MDAVSIRDEDERTNGARATEAPRVVCVDPAASSRPGALVILVPGSQRHDGRSIVPGSGQYRPLVTGLAAQGHSVACVDLETTAGEPAAASDVECRLEEVIEQQRARAEDRPLVLVGHGMGGLVALKVAARREGLVDGLALLSTIGRPGFDAVCEQHRRTCSSEGLPAEFIEHSLMSRKPLFAVLIEAEETLRRSEPGEAPRIIDETDRILRGRLAAQSGFDPHDTLVLQDVAPLAADLLAWEWRYLLTADPGAELTRVKCPVLVLAGTADAQIDTGAELDAMTQAFARNANDDVRVASLADYDHWLRPAAGPAAAPEEPFGAAAIERLHDWLTTIVT